MVCKAKDHFARIRTRSAPYTHQIDRHAKSSDELTLPNRDRLSALAAKEAPRARHAKPTRPRSPPDHGVPAATRRRTRATGTESNEQRGGGGGDLRRGLTVAVEADVHHGWCSAPFLAPWPSPPLLPPPPPPPPFCGGSRWEWCEVAEEHFICDPQNPSGPSKLRDAMGSMGRARLAAHGLLDSDLTARMMVPAGLAACPLANLEARPTR